MNGFLFEMAKRNADKQVVNSPDTLLKTVKPAGPTLSKDELMTDYGNAQRFVWQNQGNVYYLAEEKSWYLWDGKRWVVDTSEMITKLAFETAKKISSEAELLADVDDRNDLKKWARKSLDHGRIKKMIESAKAYMTKSYKDFDTHGHLLNVSNGTIDLKTGTLLPHDPRLLITKLCSVDYKSDAECPRWLDFLNAIFDGNTELICYMQKMVGYALTADISEKSFFIFYGPEGDNGKSVLVNTLLALMADYAVQNPIDTLLQRRPGALTNDLVRLKNARLVAAAEAADRYCFDEPLIKRLTGDDPITCRPMYKDYITFSLECKIILATNQIPRFKLDDRAFKNRMKIIPFMVSIPKEQQDPELKNKLLSEIEGILAWAVKGSIDWYRERLGEIPDIIEPINNDTVGEYLDTFIAEKCIIDPSVTESTSNLHTEFNRYILDKGANIDIPSVRQMGVLLTRKGYNSEHGRTGNVKRGIRLAPSTEDNEAA